MKNNRNIARWNNTPTWKKIAISIFAWSFVVGTAMFAMVGVYSIFFV